MKVILVRHAETEWNLKGMIQGHSDSPVTQKGMRETAALLTALRGIALPIDCIYSSPIGRAWQMGLSLAEGFHCPLIAESCLKEQAFGHFEGMFTSHVNHSYPDEANAMFMLDADYCPPGGESLSQASQRVMHFLHNLQDTKEHQTVCLVSHGHVSQGVLAYLKEGAIGNFHHYAHPNASYSVFSLVEGKCTELRWGVSTHLLKL